MRLFGYAAAAVIAFGICAPRVRADTDVTFVTQGSSDFTGTLEVDTTTGSVLNDNFVLTLGSSTLNLTGTGYADGSNGYAFDFFEPQDSYLLLLGTTGPVSSPLMGYTGGSFTLTDALNTVYAGGSFVPSAVTPEPSTWVLLGTGLLLGLGLVWRRNPGVLGTLCSTLNG